jgi:uncharacterized YkwD family protein
MRKSLMALAVSVTLAAGGLAAGGQAHAAAQTVKTYQTPPFDAYKISAGDTLYYIGKRYGVSLSKLFQLNPGIDPYRLYVGQIVKLRDSVPSAPSASQPAKPSQPAPSAPSSQPAQTGSYEQQVLDLVNKYRADAGLSPLKWSSQLSAMAKDKAVDMYTNHYFDHNSPTYGSPFDMMRSYGISYNYAGENIAMGQRTPQEVMTAWMNSQGHRENILNPHYTTIGIAYYNGEWVQEFIG